MSTSEADRYHLFETVRDRLQDERAAGTLMSLLPSNPDDLATKADLRGLATKEDLRGLATKEELRGLATKEELRGLATKEELANATQQLRAQMEGLATRFELAESVQRLDNRINDQGRTLLLAMMASWLTLAALIISLRFA